MSVPKTVGANAEKYNEWGRTSRHVRINFTRVDSTVHIAIDYGSNLHMYAIPEILFRELVEKVYNDG